MKPPHDLDQKAAQLALETNSPQAIMNMFTWASTPHGDDFWNNEYDNAMKFPIIPLSLEARVYLESLLEKRKDPKDWVIQFSRI